MSSLQPTLSTLRRRAWLIAFLASAGLAASVTQALRRPQVYRAESTLLIDNRPPRVMDRVTEVAAEEWMADTDRFVNSQVRLISSKSMADRVQAQLKMPSDSLLGRIQVEVDRSSYLATLAVDDLDPDRAVRIVNAFADVYVESTISDRAGVASDAARFLATESRQQRTRLEQDEQRLYDFQKTNELPASTFEDSHKIQSSNLQALHAQQSETFGLSVRLKAQLQEIHDAKDSPELRRRMALMDAGDRWTSLHERYLSLSEQAEQLQIRYGDKHPKVQETRQALDTVAQQLDLEVATAIKVVESRARSNANQQAQLKAAIAQETQRAIGLRQKELEYNQLHRQLEEDREAYALVARRHKETELQSALKQSYVRPLDPAIAAAPLGRQIPRAAGMGLTLGLLLGIGLSLLLDYLGDTVRSPEELERSLPQPLLGFISEIATTAPPGDSGGLEVQRAEYLQRFPRSIVAEQCHTLSTNIQSLFLGTPVRCLAVMSASTEDGKTLTAVNLASSAAARGRRVLLIDADLRRGRLHTLFRVAKKGGFFELLTKQVTVAEATRSTWIPQVDFIPAGDVPEKVSPMRVLELPQLHTVLAELKERYDLVVIDTAPVPMVSDALLLREVIDGAVGVVRAGKTSRRLAREMARQLAFARVNLLGWVLNGVSEAELKKKYYARRYGYLGTYGAYGEPPSKG